MPAFIRSLALVLCALSALSGCSALGSSDGTTLRVTLRYFKPTSQRFELVSESHTDRVAYYSQERTDAARKIQDDEVMGALLDEMDRVGLDDYLQDGPGPKSGHRLVDRVFEVERGGKTYHWPIGKGSDIPERQSFNACIQPFLQLYSITLGFQNVQNDAGAGFLEAPKVPRRGGRRIRS